MADNDINSLLKQLQGSFSEVPDGKYLSFDSPMGGDDVSNVAPIRVGLELVLVNDGNALCRGKVGETKMCICLSEECHIKSHKRSKVPVSRLPSSCCLLVGGGINMNWAYLTPMLDATDIEGPMIESLLERTNEDWGKLFELVAVEGVHDLDMETSLKDLSKTVRKKMLGSPNIKRQADERSYENVAFGVKKARKILADGITASKANTDIKSSLDENGHPDEEKVKAFFEAVATRLDLAVGYTMGTERMAELLYEAFKMEVATLEESIGGTKAITTMIEGTIGTRCKSIEGCHPTLWGSVAELSTTTKHHHEAINGILKSVLELKRKGGGRNVAFSPASGLTEPNSSLEGGLTAEPFFNQEGFPGADKTTGYHEPTIKDGFIRRQPAVASGSGSSGGGSSGGGSSGGGSSGSGSNSGASGNGSTVTGGQGSLVAPGLREGWEKINRLEERVDRLESSQKGSDDAVVLDGNVVLRCKQDVLAFLEEHLGTNCDIPAGAFSSPHFLLNEMMTTLGCALPNLDEFTKLKRLEVKAIDLRCSQALMTVLPVFFTSPKLSTHIYSSSSGGPGRFKAFPNAVEWGTKTDEDKLQYKCSRALQEVCRAIEDHIRDALRRSPVLQLIASNLLTKSKRVVEDCLEFLGDNYTRMMAAFDSSADAWDLGCFGIFQLFSNDFSVPLAGMKFADFSDARSTLLTAVWTNFRVGIISDAFNETGIQNHPAMSAAQVRFIIQQAKSSKKSGTVKEVDNLKAQVQSLQEVVKKQTQLLDQHTGKLVQVESRADRACAALELPLDNKKQRGKGNKTKGKADDEA